MSAPTCILVCALGGEGGGVLADWLVQVAVQAGHHAQSTSVPGVAQRTGATTYYVEVQPAAGGPRPVFSLNPVPGEIDLLLSSELLETVRQVGNGLSCAERTRIVSSTSRALTVAEKMQPGDGRQDAAALLSVLQRHALALDLLDFQALAAQAGTVISAVLLGAVAASGVLPFERAAYEAVIRASGKGVDASLRGFALAFDQLQQRRQQQAQVDAVLQGVAGAASPAAAHEPAPDLRALARRRVAAYQDEAYARLFDQRLDRLAAVDPPVAAEAARWLGLWMAFDDIVHVADLKRSASRMARVRRETGAADDEPLAVYDHFKPGVPELAALLPPPLAARLTAWDRRRVAAGHEPWALPLRVATHTVLGTLALGLVASLRHLRRHGSRFVQEQQRIEAWLAAVERGARCDHALGLELARCGRLVKGYGSTHDRGMAALLHIVEHLHDQPAAAVRAAREAALADDSGHRLDDTLAAHGAPRRPLREQPVRWYRRRRD